MKSQSKLIILLAVIVLTAITATNVHNAKADQRVYKAPCNEGDLHNKRGECCPIGTSYIVHNRCYTEEEYQERQEENREIVRCFFGETIDDIITGDEIGAVEGVISCQTQ